MNLYIKLQDGNPVDHPIIEDNFIQAFPDIDTNNLPSTFARFIRVEKPATGVYEEYLGVEYVRSGDVITDSHIVRQFTTEEISAKQQVAKDEWTELGFPSWIFNEELCYFEPPIPYPEDDNLYHWDENTVSWVRDE